MSIEGVLDQIIASEWEYETITDMGLPRGPKCIYEGNHRFDDAVQLRTRVMGTVLCSTLVSTRKRWPSRLTS